MLTLLALVACNSRAPEPARTQADYLYLWTASEDPAQPDFLAVLDGTESGSRYGHLVTTLPVHGRGNAPHRTEHEMPADGHVFANGFGSGQSFVFDMTNPATPRVASQFGDVEGYTIPTFSAERKKCFPALQVRVRRHELAWLGREAVGTGVSR